jgi:hypothetical protein
MPTDFSTFILYTGSQMNYSSPQWYREPASGDYTPMIWRVDDSYSRNGVAVGQLSLHPSSTYEASVLRWTAQSNGLYDFIGQFFSGDGGTMQVGVRQGSDWLWQGVDSGSFELSRSLTAGDAIDFVVYGGYVAGNTPLELTISSSNQPPDCSKGAPSVNEIWPPDHTMIAIAVNGVIDPDSDPVNITINTITQDEPVNEKGDGNTTPDGSGVGTNTASVRAERSGKDNGRVYQISFTADDGNGGQCSGSLAICVPHDMKPGHVCIDDGQIYDATTMH